MWSLSPLIMLCLVSICGVSRVQGTPEGTHLKLLIAGGKTIVLEVTTVREKVLWLSAFMQAGVTLVAADAAGGSA